MKAFRTFAYPSTAAMLALALLVAALLVAAMLPARAAPGQPAPGQSASGQPDPEIAALVLRVEQSDGVIFIRNGSEHSAAEAAVHLRRKLRAAHGRVHTAEQFIDHIGTRSSFSGRKYHVRLPDGRELDSATWLYSLLRELRAQHGVDAPVRPRQ